MKYFILAFISLLIAAAPAKADRYSVGKKVKPSVVYVTNALGSSGGTGFQIKSPKGDLYILTNRHVCGLANAKGEVTVSQEDIRPIQRRVLEKYWEADLCLVEALPGIPPLEIADQGMQYDTPFYIVGHPSLDPLIVREGTLIKIGLVGLWYPEGPAFVVSYITDIPSYPGNSGSPIVDQDGRVVSVLYAGDNVQNNGIGVMLEQIKAFLQQW
jgi:serine protease Do